MRTHRHNIRILTCAAAALAVIILPGCFGTGGKVEQPSTIVAPRPEVKAPVDVKALCSKVKEWTQADMSALADAVTHLDKNSPIITVMGDYKRMRDEARACRDFK